MKWLALLSQRVATRRKYLSLPNMHSIDMTLLALEPVTASLHLSTYLEQYCRRNVMLPKPVEQRIGLNIPCQPAARLCGQCPS
jgi:hypothetical protein